VLALGQAVHQPIERALGRQRRCFGAVTGLQGACHSNCVSQRCTKIDSPSWRSEGTPSDTEHIVSSG
jgi:hypothetical protein